MSIYVCSAVNNSDKIISQKKGWDFGFKLVETPKELTLLKDVLVELEGFLIGHAAGTPRQIKVSRGTVADSYKRQEATRGIDWVNSSIKMAGSLANDDFFETVSLPHVSGLNSKDYWQRLEKELLAKGFTKAKVFNK